MINHSKNFFDPSDATIHTQTVERLWRNVKRNIPKGISHTFRYQYLLEYEFKQRIQWDKISPGRGLQSLLDNMKLSSEEDL